MIDPTDFAEQQLLSRAATGDASAARKLLEETGDTVFGFVFARCGGREQEAEDITQATYTEAIHSAPSFRGDSSLTTWLCAIAKRQLSRHYEKERRRELVKSRLRLVETERDNTPPADDSDIVLALGELNSLHRRVLVLKYLDGHTVDEIATELNRTRTSVQSLLQRARDALRDAMKETP